MNVRSVMTPKPHTLPPGATLEQALELMHRYDIHEIPIVEDDDVVGMLTDRDLKMVLGPAARDLDEAELDAGQLATEVSEVMSTGVKAVYEETDLAEACRILVEYRYGALPVVDGQVRLVGIVSVTDLLSAAADHFEANA